MDKLLEAIIDTVRDFSKKYFPRINRWIEEGFYLKDRVTTVAARLLRSSGTRSIFIVAAIASIYALYLFLHDLQKPNAPKSSHDTILKTRLSGPAASKQIVIVDIDERSIASMSDKFGRWPWRRDVLADGLQKMVDLGAKGVLFNILLAEPDKQNPDADGAMNFAAEVTKISAYPLIRLNAQNDRDSQLRASALPGSIIDSGFEDKTIAVIVPLFAGMHERLGVANQLPDSDGIVRKYPYFWAETGFKLPSIVQATLFAADVAPVRSLPDVYPLNWRNKKGSYQRISFSDLFLGNLSEQEKTALKNAFIVLGVSAPGVGQTKPTGIKALTDDSEIIATALDDALNDTYLRITPAWVLLSLNLISIWSLYIIFSAKSAKSPPLNRIFIVLQVALGGVTILSASYTNYLIDLTDSMKFGLGVFAAIKLVQSLDDRWSRGRKGYRKLRGSIDGAEVLIINYFENSLKNIRESELQRRIENLIGIERVVRIDDLFSGESFLKSALSTCHGLMICLPTSEKKSQVLAIINDLEVSPARIRTCILSHPWDLDDKRFAEILGPAVIANISELYGSAAGTAITV